MSICSLRTELTESENLGVQTGAIWWMNDGATSHESHTAVPALNGSSLFLGKSLDANGVQGNARQNRLASNSRAVVTP